MEGFIFLADVFSEQVKEVTQGSGLSTRDLLLVASAVLALGFALFAWVYFRVRKKADQADRQRISQMARSSAPSQSEGENREKGERRRKRRRRRDHRPRNPSLEKTGGLPPPRPEDQPPKY